MSKEILAGEGYQAALSLKPSVFIVGDSKQSIYGFRMADSSIMDRASYELDEFGIKLANLNASYRTSQSVLDWVNSTFEPIIPSFPQHKTAQIGDKTVVPNLSNLCIAELFEAEEDDKMADLIQKEAKFVAAYVAKSIAGGEEPLVIFDKRTKKYRYLKASDCAILYRNKANSDLYMKALLEQGIESKREEGKGFFDRQEIRDHINLLKFLNTPSDSVALGSLIKSPLCPVTDDIFLKTLLKTNEFKKDLYDRNIALLNELSVDYGSWTEKIIALMNLMETKELSFILQKALTSLGSYDAYNYYPNATDRQMAQANITQLLEMTIENEKLNSSSCSELISHFDELTKADETGSTSTGANAVTLMTIHKSKGLEYPFIIVVNSNDVWTKDDRTWLRYIDNDRVGVFYLGNKNIDVAPPKNHPSYRIAQDSIKNDAYEENKRLLYVAMTRSRHHLLVTGIEKKEDKNKSEEHVSFYQCMLDGAHKNRL